MLKIRCARYGRRKSPFYRIVVIDSRKPRNGYFIEQVGYYKSIGIKHKSVKLDRVNYWLSMGAQLSDAARCIVKNAK